MKKNNATPADLARVVFNKLKSLKTSFPTPSEKVLSKLFENLFYASLKTEEGDFIKVTITIINTENPDPRPPKQIINDRWNFIRLQESIPFNVENIVKLSKAADPWSSSLAVDFNHNEELMVWGLIDQSIHYQNYLHHESDSSPEQPGLFQVSITAIGTLSVILDYDLIATLKQNILISNYVDVFKYGKLSELIRLNSKILIDEIKLYLEEFPDEKIETWENQINSLWTQTLSRVLIRIQNYKHGGSFIITDNKLLDFDIKHKIEYNRIYDALRRFVKFTIENNRNSTSIFDIDFKGHIPLNKYIKESLTNFKKKDTVNELKGAIRFVASLSCIDGLVIVSNKLSVNGFGAVVKQINLPETIYISKSARINELKLEQINPNHFGTRHRAIFSYCWKHEGSIGFVISQDGEIRAVTKTDNKLVMWENIKVHHLVKSRKFK